MVFYGLSGETMSSELKYLPARKLVIVIAGPTASGKSALAVRTAETFRGTVINADSIQMYRDLNILSGCPDVNYLIRAPHRLFGFLPIKDSSSVAVWRDLAIQIISESWQGGRVPIICGGSGMYLRALIDGFSKVPKIPQKIRLSARQQFEELGNLAFYKDLLQRDPIMGSRIMPSDRQRMIRAWEVIETTGHSLSRWQEDNFSSSDSLSFFTILLMPERKRLYANCDYRFLEFLARGALDEVRGIIKLGLSSELPGMKALGLNQLTRYLKGELRLEEAIEVAQRDTRRFAKRQLTWFRNQFSSNYVINAQYSESIEKEIFPKIRQFLLTR